MLRHIESDRITVEMAVAPIALALAAHPRLEDFDLSSLRYLMWCATPVARSVADEVTRRTGVRWATAYGASELPVISCNALDGDTSTLWVAPFREFRSGWLQPNPPTRQCL